MRIDKYLWTVRYFKTRNLATQACKKGQVKVGLPPDEQLLNAKPSREVFIGEKIMVRKNQINYLLLVLDIPSNRIAAKLVDIYRKDITPKEAFAKLELLRASKEYYRKKGTGRPTKKDRRNLEDYTDDTKSI